MFTQQEGRIRKVGMRIRVSLLVACLIVSTFTGCAGVVGSADSGAATTTVAANPNATGNWQLVMTPTSGGTLFPTLSGYIGDDVSDTTASKYTTEELLANGASGCFIGTNPIVGFGSVDGAQLSTSSVTVNGQSVLLAGTLNGTSSSMIGTYSVQGGCASGATGTFAGTRYSNVDGTFSGTVDGTSPAAGVQLNLSQDGVGNANGVFEITGSASFTGFACFNSGTLSQPNGYVTGSTISLTFSTNDPTGAQAVLQGTIDAGAGEMTITGFQVTSGSCAGTYGKAILTK